MSVLSDFTDPALLIIVDVRRPVQSVGSGGQPETRLSNTPVVSADVESFVSKLSGGEAARAFGVDSDSNFEVRFARSFDIRLNDIVELKTGSLTGTFIEVRDIQQGIDRIQLCQGEETTLV